MSSAASRPQDTDWLLEHSLKALELLFRAVLYRNSVPIVIADNDRKCLEASAGTGNLLGLSRDRLIGRRIDDFTETISRPRIEEMWRAFLEQGEQQGTMPLLGPDGCPREVEFTAKGNVLPVWHLLVLRDKTGSEQIPSWVRDYALFVLAADGRVVGWHSGAERIYGYKRDEIVGQHVSRVYASDEGSIRAKVYGEVRRGTAEGRSENEGWHQRKDGTRFWANVLTLALKDESGELKGFGGVVRDFTGRHQTDEVLRRSHGRLVQRSAESTVVGIVSGEFDRMTDVSVFEAICVALRTVHSFENG